MQRWEQAVALAVQGHSPGSVSRQMGISIETVLPYLFRGIGAGKINRAQVVFNISRNLRAAVEASLVQLGSQASDWEVVSATRRLQPTASRDDIHAYLRLRESGGFLLGWDRKSTLLGDMYQILASLEVTLHLFIRQALNFLYEENWWREGVPESIRKDCRQAQEGDPEPIDDPFCYTNFIHLKEIFSKHWGRFQDILPSEVSRDKTGLLSRLVRLNQIRNQVMHPVKQRSPTEDDFIFVQECFGYFRFLEWKVFRAEAALPKP